MLDDYTIVARQQVRRSEGMAEVGISGICEVCFDGLFEKDEK